MTGQHTPNRQQSAPDGQHAPNRQQSAPDGQHAPNRQQSAPDGQHAPNRQQSAPDRHHTPPDHKPSLRTIREERAISEQTEKQPKYEIRVSVRSLVEFLLRSGDIDNRRTGSPEKAMLEGSRLHRLIQKSMGAEYSAEVPLSYCYETPNYNVIIDGRADGIIREEKNDYAPTSLGANQISLNQYLFNEEFDQVTIDEIKCVNKKLKNIREPIPVHLAQAKVYAYIYAKQHALPFIRVRMTYCHIITEDIKYFIEEYLWEDLEVWFEDLMKRYSKWMDFAYSWRKKRNESIKKIDFPYPYREGQRDLTVYVYQTILERKKLFIEAPTGVGKTLSTVFPAVKAMGQGLTDRIFYLTAKTITRTVADETFELLRRQGLSMKTVVITARDKICPFTEAECNPDSCEYARGHFDRVNEALYELITTKDNLSRDCIAETAAKYKVCPYELSLDLTLLSDAVMCDYNYVFDPHVYLRRFFGDGNRGEYTFLIDEAHNLVDRGREMYSAELQKEDLLAAKKFLNEAVEKLAIVKERKGMIHIHRMISGLDRCNKEMLKIKRGCVTYLVLDSVDTLAGHVAGLYTTISQFLDEEENTGIRKEVLELYFMLGHFLMIYEMMDEKYRIFCEISERGNFRVKLLCVDPGKNLADCMAMGRSAVLFSATLLPIGYHKNLLGGSKEDYEVYARSVFDPSRMGLFIGRDVTSRYSRRNETEYYHIARYIYEVTAVKKGKYMIFFPSHAFLKNVLEAYEANFHLPEEEMIVRQEEYMTEAHREAFLHLFSSSKDSFSLGALPEKDIFLPGETPYEGIVSGKKSLIGFCVLGGIFSEGIDLREDSLIGCIVVGTGLPQVCSEREIFKDYFGENGFNYAYRYPGMNKVLQAAGRVIRTVNDVGVVALLDDRFLEQSSKRMFPREWTHYQVTTLGGIADCVEGFWQEMEEKKDTDDS